MFLIKVGIRLKTYPIVKYAEVNRTVDDRRVNPRPAPYRMVLPLSDFNGTVQSHCPSAMKVR